MRIIAVLAAIFFLGQLATAQSPPTAQHASSMDLHVDPTVVPAGAPAKINGTIPLSGPPLTVTISITPPSATVVSLAAKTNSKGEFSATFAQTKSAGKYQVSAVAEGAKGSASFDVIALGAVIESVKRESHMLISAAKQLNLAAVNRIAESPESPAKADLTKKIAEANRRLDEMASWNAGPEGLPQALDDLRKAIEANPSALPAVAPMFQGLVQWADLVRTPRDRFLRFAAKRAIRLFPPSGVRRTRNRDVLGGMQSSEMQEPSVAAHLGVVPAAPGIISSAYALSGMSALGCVGVSDTADLFGVASSLVNLEGSLAGVLANFALDKLLSSRDSSFAFTQATKFGAAKVQQKMEQAAGLSKGYKIGLGLDVLNVATKGLFDLNCGSLSGPIKGTIHAEALRSEDHTVWWKYDVQIKGRVFLAFSKSRGSDAPVSGYFEGKGTQFDVWEYILPSMTKTSVANATMGKHYVLATRNPLSDPSAMGLSLHTMGMLYEPAKARTTMSFTYPWSITNDVDQGMPSGGLGSPVLAWLGQFAGITASYFRVPVSGTLGSDRLTFDIGAAPVDFDDGLITAEARYLIFLPGPLAVPKVLTFALPYKNAEFILKRATDNRQRVVAVSGPSSSPAIPRKIDVVFKNKHSGPDGHAEYELLMQACSLPCAEATGPLPPRFSTPTGKPLN